PRLPSSGDASFSSIQRGILKSLSFWPDLPPVFLALFCVATPLPAGELSQLAAQRAATQPTERTTIAITGAAGRGSSQFRRWRKVGAPALGSHCGCASGGGGGVAAAGSCCSCASIDDPSTRVRCGRALAWRVRARPQVRNVSVCGERRASYGCVTLGLH